jgi:hypothetical protein
MTQRATAPMAERTARLAPGDFSEVISHLPDDCPVIGGQAVAWWAARYQLTGDKGEVITSADIDFWGSRQDLKQMAKALGREPIFPNEYEMTVWVGAIQLNIHGWNTVAEFLHTVPGLDTNDPAKASVEQQYASGSVRKTIPILSPISSVIAKLHCLRHFKQDQREDELHLRISLAASHRFLAELLRQLEIRQVLWNAERLIAASGLKPYRRIETKYDIDILGAIPIREIRLEAENQSQSEADRKRLANFAHIRWEDMKASRKS